MGSPEQTDVTPASVAALPATTRLRCRSFCFLERDDGRWTVFLITYQRPDGQWRGYFTYRSAGVDAALGEIRTADLFVEASEADVDQRARGLGRPLLLALLGSALETHERRVGYSPELHAWFRAMLRQAAAERADARGADGDAAPGVPAGHATSMPSLGELRGLYESYRVDQVAHLVALLEPDDFRELVEVLLDGRRIDFRARDRFQLAMSIVQELERRLPLPPFELWTRDYLLHGDAYRSYAAALRRGIIDGD